MLPIVYAQCHDYMRTLRKRVQQSYVLSKNDKFIRTKSVLCDSAQSGSIGCYGFEIICDICKDGDLLCRVENKSCVIVILNETPVIWNEG